MRNAAGRAIRALAAALLLALAAPRVEAQEPVQGRRWPELQKQVTGLRGLEFRRDVRVGTYNREELQRFLKGEMEREFPRAKADRYRAAYVQMGLLPPSIDLYAAYLDLIGDSLAGFYHPTTKELRLIVGTGEEEQREMERVLAEELGIKVDLGLMTLIHELCHAAQDQNFDLDTLPMLDETNDDMVLAIKALVEGDATVVGLKHGFGRHFDVMGRAFTQDYKDGALPGRGAELPAFLRKSFTFPYGHGADFVLHLLERSKGDWKAVSAAFQDLPASTEQILHPRKYSDRRDEPTLMTLKDLAAVAGPDLREVFHNVLGEFGILILLDEARQGTSRERRDAAAGWDGDRYYVLEGATGLSSVWISTWDSEEDAAEFFASFSGALAARWPDAKRTPAAQRVDFTRADGRRAAFERRGSDCLLLDGDPALAEKINPIWSAAGKAPMPPVARVAPRR